jgi:hypothetical protein
MFGMLDYRAHKLYKVLAFPFVIVLGLFAILGLPSISYLIAANFTSQGISRLLLAAVILFLIGIPWFFVVKILFAIPVGIFNFLIDPVPADGRNKEEAKIVVRAGQKGIAILELNRPASEWSDEAIESLSTLNLTSTIFQDKIRRRIYAIKNYYMAHPDLNQNEYTTKQFLKKNKLSIGPIELVITNPMWRTTVLQALVLLVIFIITSP